MSTIDALPYYDKEVDIPGLKDLAKAEIDRELANVPKVTLDDPRIPPALDVFPKSQHLQTLLDTTYSTGSSSGSSRPSMKAIDPSKWQIPQLSTEESGEEEWEEAEKRSRVNLAHLGVRNTNISLLTSHAPNAWLIRNYQLESQAKELETLLLVQQEKLTELNRSRRVYQESTGEQLGRLETRWQDLITSTVQLEMANKALEGEVRRLRREKEGLKKDVEMLEEQMGEY